MYYVLYVWMCEFVKWRCFSFQRYFSISIRVNFYDRTLHPSHTSFAFSFHTQKKNTLFSIVKFHFSRTTFFFGWSSSSRMYEKFFSVKEILLASVCIPLSIMLILIWKWVRLVSKKKKMCMALMNWWVYKSINIWMCVCGYC